MMSDYAAQKASGQLPGSEAVRAQIARISSSPAFERSPRSREFLQFIVEATLAGRIGAISQQTIAAQVFGRSDDFDPAVDPIVRMQAGRVRRALEHYYLTTGAGDPVLVRLPKGAYVPSFALNATVPTPAGATGRPGMGVDAGSWPSLLITPFRNLTGREEVDFIALGLVSDLAAELSRYADLHVFLAPGPLTGVGEPCPARFQLAGTVAPRGHELKINLHLTDRTTGRQIWAYSWPCPTGASLGPSLDQLVQSTTAMIAEEQGIVPTLLVEEMPGQPRPGAGAYEAILRYHHFELLHEPALFAASLDALRQAVIEHPDCALCWSYLARLGAVHWSMGMPGETISIEESLEAARRGVAMNGSDLRTRMVLAYVHLVNDQLDQARGETDMVVHVNRESLFWLDAVGYLLTLSGDWEQGPERIRRAMRMNPYHRKICYAALWLDAVRRGDPAAALAAASEYAPVSNLWSPLMSAVAMALAGLVTEAEAEIERLLDIQPAFRERGRWLISRHVKFEPVVDTILDALARGGLSATG